MSDIKIEEGFIPPDRQYLVFMEGGQGSGNFGHAGRDGQVGGSGPSKGIKNSDDEYDDEYDSDVEMGNWNSESDAVDFLTSMGDIDPEEFGGVNGQLTDYASAGILTSNDGLILKTQNGELFLTFLGSYRDSREEQGDESWADIKQGFYDMVDSAELPQGWKVRSFSDAGVLSGDKGVVITYGGRKYQVSITNK